MINIHQIIDWKLLSDEKVIVDLKNVKCTYLEDDKLIFKEDNIINKINLKDNVYERIASDYIMNLNFSNKICTFTFPTKEVCKFDITGNITKENNSIIIKYTYGEELKEIHIKLKEGA